VLGPCSANLRPAGCGGASRSAVSDQEYIEANGCDGAATCKANRRSVQQEPRPESLFVLTESVYCVLSPTMASSPLGIIPEP
jgi:hypothetical protein